MSIVDSALASLTASPRPPSTRRPATKPTLATNPKDAIGVRKWRQFFAVPYRVMWEVGVGMLEGAMKYGRFNYRVTGVQASIYIDASRGHIDAWCEGQDDDPDTGLSHITKAICSLIVLRDGMLEGNFVDDRAPRHLGMDAHTTKLQGIVDAMFDKHGDPAKPFTQADRAESSHGVTGLVPTSAMEVGYTYKAVFNHQGDPILNGGEWRIRRVDKKGAVGVKDAWLPTHPGIPLAAGYWWRRLGGKGKHTVGVDARPSPLQDTISDRLRMAELMRANASAVLAESGSEGAFNGIQDEI